MLNVTKMGKKLVSLLFSTLFPQLGSRGFVALIGIRLVLTRQTRPTFDCFFQKEIPERSFSNEF